MSNLNTEALIDEFHARLRSGKRADAFELVEPELRNGDLRLVLVYSAAKLEAGDALAAVTLLRQHEQHSQNSHYALLAAVAAKVLIGQTSEWGEQAERELVYLINNNPEQEGLESQLQRYVQLCVNYGVSPNATVRDAIPNFTPKMPAGPETKDLVTAIFRGYRDGNPTSSDCNLVIPGAPLFLENNGIQWRPGVSSQSNLDVGEREFKVYSNVRLYMLPYMYGLIEVEDGVFLGTLIGGCNPYTQGIVTIRGDRLYKNLAHPLLDLYPERKIEGARLIPFRLAGTYYFHFCVETMQTIFEARHLSEQAPVLLPRSPGFFDRIPRSVHDVAVGSIRTSDQRYEFIEDGIYRLDEVVVPTRIKYGNVTYQKNVLSALGVGDLRYGSGQSEEWKLIYIARRSGMVRTVINEEELVARLAAHYSAFQRIYLEDMSYGEQIKAFRDADAIVAPHGGGLTNILFCRPGTCVIEFHLPDTGIMYWHLSLMQRLRYLAYVPESFVSTKSGFVIRPERLIEAIDRVAALDPGDPDCLPRW